MVRRMFSYGCVVVAAGCGEVAAKMPDAAVADTAVTIDSSMSDSMSDAPTGRCSATGAFGQIGVVGGINNNLSDEFGLRLLPDELTGVFARRPASDDSELYIATRGAPTDAFGNVTLIPVVNGPEDNFAPSITADGRTLYQMVSTTSNGYDIVISSRSSTAASFGTPSGPITLNTTFSERDPYVLPAGDVLYFSRNDATSENIMRTTLGSGGFSTPAPVTELNAANQVTFAPVVTPDELTVYFASSRPDTAAKGGYDIFYSTRTSTTQSWGTPVILPALNSAADEIPSWISADGCVLYFSSKTQGSFDMFRVQRGF